jgi:hypothetical protein
MRRARRQLTGPLAIAGLLLAVGCSRSADAVPAPAGSAPAATARAAGTPAAPRAAASAAVGGGAPTAGGPAATCAGLPLGFQVASVRRESADSIRVELLVANPAPADGGAPGSPAAAAAQAAVDALDGASVLSADGRRRMFALRDAAGERVGPPATVPGPGRAETIWRLFPAAEPRVTLLLPGCAPLPGLAVAPRPGQPEP